MYSDDMPDGADIVFNTNKHTGTPKMDVLKKIQDDPDNPFGALIKANGQSHYIDADGNEKLSAINKLKEEGDWDKMSKNLSSQFLSKQPIQLIKKQLDLTYADAADEFSEICSLNNPTVKRKLLLDFADECDSAAVHLKAAALPRQSTQVILPLNAMKETEIFAPNYRDGEKVVLIRYPHGGTFEIPELTVNNKNPTAVSVLGKNIRDAVGINPKVAERLSGADFDGDQVVVIPTGGRVKIQSTPALKDLKDFDPKTDYSTEGKTGVRLLAKGAATQRQMGEISNLITDMTLKGATEPEIARAVKHSMVVIDAAKHKLDYLNANVEAVKLLDEIRVISRPHGLDRVFPVTKLEIPLDSPENTKFTLGDTVQTSLTSVNNQISAAILEKIEGLPKAHNILKEAKENATQIMTAATTGYITITRDEYGSDTLYISNIRDYTKADKLWKWNMNGLGYSKDYGKTFGLAITMDGSIVADYITTGVLNADVIRAGTLKDYGGNFSLDFETGKLTMKKGSIDIGGGNFTVDEEGNLTARRGTFAGTLAAAKGTFSGTLVGVDGNFKGVVQASDFLDRAGNSMMDDERFKSKYLSVYGLTVTNGVRTTFAVDSSGSVTIDGKVTLSAGSTINWASVTNQNLTSNPAYSLASTANANAATAKSAADDAYDEASAAWSRANKAYQDRCTDQNVFDVLTSGGTKFGIFSDSYSGRLYINADYIRSGTINADYIDLSCDYGGFCKGHGSDGQHTTYGAMMYGSNGPGWEPYIIQSIQLTQGNHTPGSTDIYTVTMTDGNKYNIAVYNGLNGTGTGDVLGIHFDLVLPASGWSNGSITVAESRLVAAAKYKYLIDAYEASREEYLECNVRPKDISTTGFITFVNDTDPIKDITVNIVRLELSVNAEEGGE